MSGRPLDELEAAVGADVTVRLKSGETYRGTLSGYDQHMNLVLEDLADGPGSALASAADDAATGGADGPDADAGGSSESDASEATEAGATPEGEATAVDQDTTIIRGDNVVSITL